MINALETKDVAPEPTRSLSMLNERGDTTITWEADEDERMLELIEKKMAVGVSFFIVPQRKPGKVASTAKPKKLNKIEDATKHRALSIPDEDLSKFVLEGRGKVVTNLEPPKMEGAGVRRAKTARDVATNHTVGVKPRKGG